MDLVIFFLFKYTALVSASLVVLSSNPVHSVLFLILVFCNAAGLLFLLRVEFLALIFVIVYVGAIAVLFLFVCMMLDIKSEEIKFMALSYLPITSFLGFFLIYVLNYFLQFLLPGTFYLVRKYIIWANSYLAMTNTKVIAVVLYTFYFIPFILTALILLIAMLGSILLTLSHRKDVLRQNIFVQVKRSSLDILRKG